MAIQYNEETIGTMVIEQKGQKFGIQIRQGNCLAVFIHVEKDDEGKGYIHTLYNFYVNEKHLKNLIEHYKNPFADKVLKMKLNMKYKESFILLKHLVHFTKIECYYK